MKEPFVARFRYHPAIRSLEWLEAEFALTRRGDKYQFLNVENGQVLILFDSQRGSRTEFDLVLPEHTVNELDKYLIFYFDEDGYRYYVWYDDEKGLYNMDGAAWDYGADSWKYQKA